MGRYPSVTPLDQLWQQLGVRFYSMWYYIRSGVSILARKKELNWISMLCQATNSIFWMLTEAIFMLFRCQKVNFLNVKKPKHFPTRALPWTPQTPSCFWHYAYVSCSYNLGTFSATKVNFFSVLTRLLFYFLS